MKQMKMLAAMMVVVAVVTACSESDDDWADSVLPSYTGGEAGNGGGGSSQSGASYSGDLATFDISIDQTALSESETVPSDDDDYVENSTFASEVSIVYSGSSAQVSGGVEGVEATVSNADVVIRSSVGGVKYVVSGQTSDGFLKIYSDKKFQLALNGVSIKNPDGAAINIQSKKRVFVTLADGTTNTIEDGTAYADKQDDEDMKAALFSEGQLLFSGSGALEVYGHTKAAICSDDYVLFRPGCNVYAKSTAGNGIKANDAIIIRGGVVNVETTADASKALKSDGYVEVSGGRTIAVTTGGGAYDTDDRDAKGCAGVKADSVINISGGKIYCKSTGTGGKGISSDQAINISGGEVKAITQGKRYSYSGSTASAKGIKADGNIHISGGQVMVRATGGEGSEGIESKQVLTIDGGQVEVYSYDDCINSASHMYIKGGYIFGYATNNDGLDANGNLYIQGGTTVVYGTTQPECGIDANEEGGYSVVVSGGTLVGFGGGTSYPSSASTQPSLVYGGSVAQGTAILLQSGTSGLLGCTLERNYGSSVTVFVTSPDLKKGSSYELFSGSSLSGTDWHGLIISPTVTAEGTSLGSVSSLSSPYSQLGNASGGMGGGMQPGGGPGGRW